MDTKKHVALNVDLATAAPAAVTIPEDDGRRGRDCLDVCVVCVASVFTVFMVILMVVGIPVGAALAGACTHDVLFAVNRPTKGIVLRRFETFVDLASACTYEVAVGSAVSNLTVKSSSCQTFDASSVVIDVCQPLDRPDLIKLHCDGSLEKATGCAISGWVILSVTLLMWLFALVVNCWNHCGCHWCHWCPSSPV